MKVIYPTIAVLVLSLLLFPAVAFANQLTDGQTAYLNKDFQTSLKLLQPLADQGNAEAQYWVGNMYFSGESVTKDFVEGVKWYRKAAEQGFAPAQGILGSAYEHGWGTKIDYAEALKWYQKSADQGYAASQMMLGNMYFSGRGVKQDYEESYFWEKLAEKVAPNSPFLKGLASESAKNLTSEQKSAVEARVQDWKPVAVK